MSTSKIKIPYHHGDLREELVTAALALMREEGEDAASLRAVARRVGVSAMAPYRHFADKAALMEAVAERGFGLLAERLMAGDAPGTTPEESFAGQGAAYVAFAREQPQLFRLMFGIVKPKPDTALGDAANRAYGILTTRAASLSGKLSTEDLALMAWSLVHGLAVLIINGCVTLDEPGAAEGLAQQLTHQFAGLLKG